MPVMTKPLLSISIGQHSTAGAKSENQDFHGALVPEGADLASKGIACVIADGISTSQRGAEAAEITVKSFLSDYYCTSEGWSVRKSGECVIGATNSWMHSENSRQRPREEGFDREAAGLICTLSALVFKSRMAHVFHIGDGQVMRLAEDRCDVLTTPHRVSLGGGTSYLGRALGMNRHVEVEYCQAPLQVGDIFVLTTDGVHELVGEDDVRKAIGVTGDLDVAARDLCALALERGSTDNLTIQLLRVDDLPLGEVEDLLGQDTRLPPAPLLEVGQTFEGYAILEKIHSGNRSHAYLACDLAENSPVVIKVLSTEQTQNPDAVAALLLEEWVMRRLSHPNLLAAAPTHAPRRHVFCVSRLVEGKSLYKSLLDNGPMPLSVARKLASQIAAGLEAMHRREMLHRDLRPQNIILNDRGHATIIDFGSTQVAGIDEAVPRAFEDAAFAGTMQYSAPELFLGDPASVRSDIFSLGVIVYQLLTGELPYGPRVSAASTPAAQRKLRYTPATTHNPDIPEWVDAAIARAVSVDPRQRYAEPALFVDDLAGPNQELLKGAHLPALQRGSVRVWKLVSAALAAALLISIITRPDVYSGPTTPSEEPAP